MEFADLTWPWRTERLLLRPRTAEDLPRLYQIRTAPGVDEWLQVRDQDWPSFSARSVWDMSQPDKLGLVGLLDGHVVVDIALQLTDGWSQNTLPQAKACQAEFGYVVDPAYAGRGLATEAVTAILQIVFERLGLRRIVAGCFAENIASRRVLERVGMRCEAYYLKESLHVTRGWLDGCEYAMLREEWLTARDVVTGSRSGSGAADLPGQSPIPGPRTTGWPPARR